MSHAASCILCMHYWVSPDDSKLERFAHSWTGLSHHKLKVVAGSNQELNNEERLLTCKQYLALIDVANTIVEFLGSLA